MTDTNVAELHAARELIQLGKAELQAGRREAAKRISTRAADALLTLRRDVLCESESSYDLCDALAEVGWLEAELGWQDAAQRSFDQCCEIRRQCLSQLGATPRNLRALAATLMWRGDFGRDMGKLDEACVDYEEALRFDREFLALEGRTAKAVRAVRVALQRLGDADKVRNRIAQAYLRYEEGLALAREILAQTGDTQDSLLGLIRTLSRLADLDKALHDVSAARERFAEASSSVPRLLKQGSGDLDGLRVLRLELHALGNLGQSLEQHRDSHVHLLQCLELSRSVAEASGSNVEDVRMLGRCLLNLGDAELSLDEPAKARGRFLEGGDVLSSLLAKDGNDAEALKLRVGQLTRLGDVERALGRTAEGYQLMLDGLVAGRNLFKLTGESPEALRDLSVALQKVGVLANSLDLPAQARTHLQESVRILERLIGLVGKTPESTRDLHVALLNLSQACASLGEHHEAVAHLEQAAAVADSCAALVGVDAQALRDISVIQTNLGQVNLAVGHVSAARDNFERALAEIERADRLTGSSWALSRDKALNYWSLGDVERADGKDSCAAELYSQAVALLRRVRSEPGCPVHWRRDLGVALERSGDLERRRGNRIQAELFYAERLAVAKEVLDHEPDVGTNRLDIALAHSRLGDLCRDEGDHQQALEHYTRQLGVLQSIDSGDPPTVHWQYTHALCLGNIGDMFQATGSVPAATIAWSNSWAMLRQLPASNRWWPSVLQETSERIIRAVEAEALELRRAFSWRMEILERLDRHLDLSNAEVVARAWPEARQVHYAWLGLALREARSKIPECLGALHGRNLLALAGRVDDAPVDEAGEAAGQPHDARRLVLRQELAELRIQLRTAEAVGQLMRSNLPGNAARRVGEGTSPDVVSKEDIAAAFGAKLQEYRDQVLPALSADAIGTTGLPSVGEEFIRKVLSRDEAVLILFQPASSVPLADPDDARPQGYLMTNRRTWRFLGPEFESERLDFDGLQDAAAAVRRIGSVGNGRAGHRSGGVVADVVDAKADTGTDRLDEIMDTTFWARVVPRLEGVRTLHIVPHAELHVLPFGETAPARTKKGAEIDVHVHPGLVTFWLMTRDRLTARGAKGTSSAAVAARVAREARVAALAYSPPSGPRPPIPFVDAEVNALKMLWPVVRPMSGAGEVDILHLAGHGSGAELETGPSDSLGLQQLLRSGLRPRIVYCSACLVGKIDENLDGDPLGLVLGFVLRTARFVVAPSVGVSDFHSALLSVPFHVALKEQHERGEPLNAHRALREAKDQLLSAHWPERTREILCSAYKSVMKQELERVLAGAEAGRVDARAEVARLMTAWVEPTSGFRAVHADADGPSSVVFDTGGVAGTRAEAGAAAAARLLLRDSAKLATLPEVQTLLRFVNVYGAPQGAVT